ERLVQKMFAEYQAKRYDVDIIDGTVSPTMVHRANLLQRFYSPVLADYPAELKDPQGYWGSTNLYFFATGYNTRMVKPNEVPKTYEDLLNPRWKGQMIWSTSRGSGAPIMIGTILNTMGPEAGKAYLQKLKAQNIAKSTASNRQILDLTIAGEFPIALHIFNHHAYISKRAGDRYDPNYCVGKKHAPPPYGNAVIGLCLIGERPKGFSTIQLFAVPSKGAGK